jgi:excinuclease ABC subunit A
VKISSELYRPHVEKTIYLLDEPSIGLHYEDIAKLIEILNKLVDKGNSVVLIEHNLDIVKCADHIIDIGPEGGVGGGRLSLPVVRRVLREMRRAILGIISRRY